ncbi:MAG: L-glutamate gamma-semialdehyde dehydrogenase [Pseudomonadota bacterium]
MRPPAPRNERVREYLPGSAERASLARELSRRSSERIDLPLVIDGREVRTGRTLPSTLPHDHARVVADAHLAAEPEIAAAIAAAKRAAPAWGACHWSERAAVFLKAAELLAGPWRDALNAATMLGQSKTLHQAEIDAAAELIDFWRFNVEFLHRMYSEQPLSADGTWNRLDYRPLEGFVFAITPFNFTAIAGNLPTAPALMGNTVVWKPAATAMYSAHFVMALLRAAGLPEGVINLVYGDPAGITARVLADRDLAGVHFTGSTGVFNGILKEVAAHPTRYRAYPRVVGETGGKNFLVAHASADDAAVVTAIIRGAFEYQGQKCSAASRLYLPRSRWLRLREALCDEMATIRVGDVADFGNFMGAVIDAKAWTRHDAAIAEARHTGGLEIVAGGRTDRTRGYFVDPTLVLTGDPGTRLMREELFGPIAMVYVYDDARYDEVLHEIDTHSDYGLTGAVFARERAAVALALTTLRNAAGNFYINDKPTGAVVGQQPFGGARASGTNDKAGSMWNLMRWVSPRVVKETFVSPTNYRYPFLASGL